MKKALIVLLVLAAAAAGAGAYYRLNTKPPEVQVMTAKVSRGDIVDTIGATGTLQAVTTVQVGSQVSGIIKELYADFNSIVKKGQVVARLDPSLFQTQIEQARANLIRSQADVDRLKVTLEDAKSKLKRAQELSERNLIPRSELETAEVLVRSTEAQIKSSQAQVTQSEAALNQNQVNLEHTIITAPIDGIVISRNVDIGQTVAASMSAPTLFIIAADLTKMQVNASVDESDVGRIRPNQQVRFRVDAYAGEEFHGTLSQVRLQPVVVQNVVTYNTVIDVPNPELKLKPGMTANVTIEVARRNDVLRVPNAALRFRPTNEIFEALNQTPPEGFAGGGGRGGREGRQAGAGPNAGTGGAGAPAASASPGGAQPPAAQTSSRGTQAAQGTPAAQGEGRGGRDRSGSAGQTAETRESGGGRGFGGSGGGFGGRGGGGGFGGGGGAGGRGGGIDRTAMMERLQNMPPEQRERFLQRMRDRESSGGDAQGGRGAGAGRSGGGRGGEQAARPSAVSAAAGGTTIDSLFGPLPAVDRPGTVWVHANSQLKPVRVRVGIQDGAFTELLSGELQPNMDVVTGVITPAEQRTNTGPAGQSPLMGPQRGRGGPGGPGGGGGGRGR
jgi:HlyD family secretion protein